MSETTEKLVTLRKWYVVSHLLYTWCTTGRKNRDKYDGGYDREERNLGWKSRNSETRDWSNARNMNPENINVHVLIPYKKK